ncbi:MAG: hypothetical protein PVG66_06220 [Chromatiales bacterium]|jgi:hypothetical protein
MTTVYDMVTGEFITEQTAPAASQAEQQPSSFHDLELRLQTLETTLTQDKHNFMHALPIPVID